MAMKAALRVNISNIGDELLGEIKSGRKARKNIDSLGLRMLIKKPLCMIFHKPFWAEDESNLSAPVSRHMDQAR